MLANSAWQLICQALPVIGMAGKKFCRNVTEPASGPDSHLMAPKIMIVSMWSPETQIWYDQFPKSGLGDLTSVSINLPGLSMLFPNASCTADTTICHVTLGEGEINAAASMAALVLSPLFDLRKTYFLLGGIAGVNPRHGTIGGVALARFVVQVALQYEIDARSVPADWSTGYIAYGRQYPLEYPLISYGTEVFELNADLRDAAFSAASGVNLSDSNGPIEYRARYAGLGFPSALTKPALVKCDSATSDVYYSGQRLAEAFENTTTVWTNGTGVYCMSAQEDSAALEVLVRGAVEGLVDFARVLVMRAGSNFDRPPPNTSDWSHLVHADQNGFYIALDNIYRVGIAIVSHILDGWGCTYADGIPAKNYIGDIHGSLGGHPDFGMGSLTEGQRVMPQGIDGPIGLKEMKRREQYGRRKFVL